MTREAIFLGPSIMPTFLNECALIDEKLRSGYDVDIYYCAGDRRYCSAFRDAKFIKRKLTCFVCKANLYSAKTSLSKGGICFKPLKFQDSEKILPSTSTKNNDLKLSDYDLESPIKSAIHTDFIDLDLKQRNYRNIQNDILKDNLVILEKLKERHFQTYNSIIIYNGRAGYYDLITQFCEKMRIKFYTYEYPYMSHSGMIFYENFRVHNFGKVSELLAKQTKNLEQWQIEFGAAKLDSRIKKNSDQDIALIPSYNKNQIPASLPELLRNKQYVIFYASTEEEVAAIREVNLAGTIPQDIIVRSMLERLGKYYKVVVKMHPNMSKSRASYVETLRETENLGVYVIDTHDKFDTYELMLQAELVVVKGSFTGIEASYLGKCVINIGDTFYSRFPSINTVHNLLDLTKYLDRFVNGDLMVNPEIQKEDASRFMYTFIQPTEPLKSLKKINLYKGNLEGYKLLNFANIFLRYINRLINRINKL